MAGLPSFGMVNVGALSNAIAVAMQQASVSHHSLGEHLLLELESCQFS